MMRKIEEARTMNQTKDYIHKITQKLNNKQTNSRHLKIKQEKGKEMSEPCMQYEKSNIFHRDHWKLTPFSRHMNLNLPG